MRVSRLGIGTAWSQNPRTRHLVTNVEVTPARKPHEFNASSNVIVYRNRRDREESWLVGAREDLLRRVAGELKIVHREIILDQHVLFSKNPNDYL